MRTVVGCVCACVCVLAGWLADWGGDATKIVQFAIKSRVIAVNKTGCERQRRVRYAFDRASFCQARWCVCRRTPIAASVWYLFVARACADNWADG